ncbi:MAG: PEP-CTERM sorting domain-containing protein [Gluconacetobacter diazotrophicus]|nr:PEP-CTERM sorting domain-containing protein [Gluconacetobacter diazotrophicus]
MKLKFAFPAAVAATCLAFAGTARAAAYTETGDAGDLPATAQIVTGTGGTTLDSISGALTLTNNVSDGDMYEIYISSPSTFSASDTAFVAGKNNFDSQIFLFSASGLGLLANDDSPSGGSQSSIPAANFSGPAGLYYLCIDGSGRYPVSSTGLIFPNQNDAANDDPTTVYGPTGPGGGNAVSGYTGNSSEAGSYVIALAGAQFVPAAAPEPGTYAGVLAGAAGLALLGRFRRRAAR